MIFVAHMLSQRCMIGMCLQFGRDLHIMELMVCRVKNLIFFAHPHGIVAVLHKRKVSVFLKFEHRSTCGVLELICFNNLSPAMVHLEQKHLALTFAFLHTILHMMEKGLLEFTCSKLLMHNINLQHQVDMPSMLHPLSESPSHFSAL